MIKKKFSPLVGLSVNGYSWLLFLALLPNLLGLINISIGSGWKIHFFQLAIFLAANRYGAIGGLMSGAFGSFYTTISMGNPYIMIGNMILGLVCGALRQRRWPLVLAVLTAFAVQLLWLWPSDLYLIRMPAARIGKITLSLLLTNTLWAVGITIGQKFLTRIFADHPQR